MMVTVYYLGTKYGTSKYEKPVPDSDKATGTAGGKMHSIGAE